MQLTKAQVNELIKLKTDDLMGEFSYTHAEECPLNNLNLLSGEQINKILARDFWHEYEAFSQFMCHEDRNNYKRKIHKLAEQFILKVVKNCLINHFENQ